METGILVAVISAAASVLAAALSFFFAVRKEKESDWRRIKFEYYREFMTALSNIVGSDSTPDGHRQFARASNTVQFVASRQVIDALHNFRDEIAGSNPHRSREKHDELLSRLIREIRFDLGISPKSNPVDLSIRLYISGNDSK